MWGPTPGIQLTSPTSNPTVEPGIVIRSTQFDKFRLRAGRNA
jgi:hypothetical protein